MAICKMSEINVLVFHSGSLKGHPSGELIVAQSETRELKTRGYRVKLRIIKPSAWINISNPFCSLFRNIWSIKSYWFVKQQIKLFKPSVVHFHGLYPYLSTSALAAAYESGVGVVQTLHNVRWICLEGGFYRDGQYCDDCVKRGLLNGVRHGCKNGKLISFLLYLSNRVGMMRGNLFSYVDRFIAVSDFIAKKHIEAGFPSCKIVVKGNMVDPPFVRTETFDTIRQGIVYVGRISRAKGADVLRHLIENFNCPFYIVGDGPDLPSLKRYCAEHSYMHVEFLGSQTQERCLEIISSACCTVVPSQCGEAFSLAAAESMSLGTPVVGSNIGGLGELLQKSGGGIAVEPDSKNQYVSAVYRLLTERGLARSLGEAGQRYAEAHLYCDRNISELIEVYHTVLEEKARHADRV